MNRVETPQAESASAAAQAAADDELQQLLARIQSEFAELRTAGLRWSLVALRRTQMGAVDLFFVAALYLVVLAAILTLAIAGSAQMVLGASRWLDHAFGATGGGAFLAGALGAALAFGLGFCVRAILRRRIVAATRRQLSGFDSTEPTRAAGGAR